MGLSVGHLPVLKRRPVERESPGVWGKHWQCAVAAVAGSLLLGGWHILFRRLPKGGLMKVLRKPVLSAAAAAALVVSFQLARPAYAQSQTAGPAHGIVGAWTFNAVLSDKPPSRSQDGGQGDQGSGQSQGGGSRGYGGRHGRGGYGGGGG